MRTGISNSNHVKTNLAGVIDKKDDKYVKLNSDGKLKIGYSSISGELKFQKLSDEKIKGKIQRQIKTSDGNTITQINWKYSPRAEEIRDTMGAVVANLMPAIQQSATEIITEKMKEHGLKADDLDGDFSAKIGEIKHETTSEVMAYIGELLLHNKGDAKSGLERITVGDIKNAMTEGDKFLEKKLGEKLEKQFKTKMSEIKWKQLTSSHEARPASDGSKPLLGAGRRSSQTGPRESRNATIVNDAGERSQTSRANESPKSAGEEPVSTRATAIEDAFHNKKIQLNRALGLVSNVTLLTDPEQRLLRVKADDVATTAKEWARTATEKFNRRQVGEWAEFATFDEADWLTQNKRDFKAHIEKKMLDLLNNSPRREDGTIEIDYEAHEKLARAEMAKWLSGSI